MLVSWKTEILEEVLMHQCEQNVGESCIETMYVSKVCKWTYQRIIYCISDTVVLLKLTISNSIKIFLNKRLSVAFVFVFLYKVTAL